MLNLGRLQVLCEVIGRGSFSAAVAGDKRGAGLGFQARDRL